MKDKKRAPLSQQATAYHEAGHAVAGHALGRRIKRVTIIPSRIEKYAGCCFTQRGPSLKGIDWDVTPKIRRDAHDLIMFSMAGICAQRLFNPRTLRSFHGSMDYRTVVDFATHLTRENELEPFLRWMEIRTENLIRDNWNAVEMLAAELVRHREVTGKEAHEIIRSAPFSPNWDNEQIQER
jgi:hypothetical protein